MEIFIQSAILSVSLAVVAYSATILIDSMEKIADGTGLGKMTIGFIMLSVITSLPEMTVAIFSSLGGVAGISVGDILGSNVSNITFILSREMFKERCCLITHRRGFTIWGQERKRQ